MSYCIGVDLGGTFIKAGVVNNEGRLMDWLQIPTGVEANSTSVVMQNIKDSIKTLIERNKDKKIKAIGAGVPGIADDKGKITIFSNIKVFDNYPMAEELASEFKLPAFVDNDANNAATGEFLFGTGRGRKNFVLITVGTGIGAGIFINGKIYHGRNGCAGEVGHMLISPDGRLCGCGNHGCWESFASAQALIKKARELIRKGIKTSLIKFYPDNLSAKVITEEAKSGDKLSLELFEEMCRYLGIGIANLVNILNPELCIIGGGVSGAKDFLLDRVKFYARMYSIPYAYEGFEIKLAELGNDAGILGSAALAFTNAG
ncbi:MAG: ROK family protein [Brevinematia bacterium]